MAANDIAEVEAWDVVGAGAACEPTALVVVAL